MQQKIQFIDRNLIDEKKWEQLVQKTGATVYNQLIYLDTLAENWMALIVNDYEAGIALPYTIRLGVKNLYTPNFIRAVDWMGEIPHNKEQIESDIKQRFHRANFNLNQELFSETKQIVFQVIEDRESIVLGSQTKRGIKKFEKTGLEIKQCSINDALPLIVNELRSKVESLRDIDFTRFEKLLLNYNQSSLTCYGIESDKTIHAAIILIEWGKVVLHIKSGVDDYGKKNGLMHALMYAVIERTINNKRTFSFEGSFVASVKQFNIGFGAKNRVYYSWNWNHSPWWFKMLQKLKS